MSSFKDCVDCQLNIFWPDTSRGKPTCKACQKGALTPLQCGDCGSVAGAWGEFDPMVLRNEYDTHRAICPQARLQLLIRRVAKEMVARKEGR